MKHPLPLVSALLLAPLTALQATDAPSNDLALEPAHIIVSPWKQHVPPTKRQGVAGIERTAKGRLGAVDGRDVESTRNFQVLKCSDDDGKRCSEVKLMILPREGTRAMSAAIWIDPQGRLWLFCGQIAGQADGRSGVWAIRTDGPDAADPKWSPRRRIGDGIMLKKPTVLANGEPHGLIEALAPFALSVLLKDMAVQSSDDGFLISEVPLGAGMLDLPRIVATLTKANTRIVFNLEMATRDPVRIPCLTDGYFATFPERKATHLDAAMKLVKVNPPKQPPPTVSGKATTQVLAEKETNNRHGLAWMQKNLRS